MKRNGAHNTARGLLLLLATLTVSLCASSTALALPEGRAYEMVSPPYKGSYGIGQIEAVSPNGESVAFFSPGVFANAPAGASGEIDPIDYLAHRIPTGWQTTPIMPPDELLPEVPRADISPDLSTSLAIGESGPNNEEAKENPEERFLVHSTQTPDVNANWEQGEGSIINPQYTSAEVKAPEVSYSGGSSDFCHLMLYSTNSRPLVEKAIGLAEPLYEFNRGCDGEPSGVRLVGVNNEGNPISSSCEVAVGLGSSYNTRQEGSAWHDISSDGGTVFFTTCTDKSGLFQLFARLGGSRTIEVSRPLSEACGVSEIPCAGAAARPSSSFAGASEDGSKVYFTTIAPLVPGDTDPSENLYLANIGCPQAIPGCSASERAVTSLVQVSRDPNVGGEAGVQGVARVSPDGSRVYYVASGDLLSAAQQSALQAAGHAVPQAGADNLYVYDSATGETAFVADLCAGFELSGSVEDTACPSQSASDVGLWRSGNEKEGANQAQTAGVDGRFLVFGSVAQLTPDDTDAARDVYRYDAVTDSLERVSTGENGADDSGNNSAFEASILPGNRKPAYVLEQYELNNRAVSEDGSRIVFETAEPLSLRATNGLVNVYEWHKEPGWAEGRVALVSSGTGETPVNDAVIDPTGQNIFFIATQQLVTQDTDAAADIYDARLGGGFSSTPVPTQPCSGDACQGPLTNPASLLVPGSVSQAPGEDLPLSASKGASTPKKASSKCAKGRRRVRGKCVRVKTKKPVKRAKRRASR